MPEIIIDQETLKLLDEMGFVPSTKSPKLYEIEIKDGFAYVDFRKVDGRRFAMIKNKPVDDEDSIPILAEFKKRRDEIKNKLLENIGASQSSPDDKQPESQDNKLDSHKTKVGGATILHQEVPTTPTSNEGVKTAPPPTPIKEQQPIPPGASQSKSVFFDEIVPAYEIDICELFGGAGDGKSRVAKKIAEEALDRGKKVLYVDTERGFLKRDLQRLGSSYRYISNLKGVMDLVKNIPKDIDVFILDSVGYPVLTEWAKMGVNERGNALTQIIAIKDLIKDWAISNNKIALIINQPDSDFGKEQGYVNRPFGDKGQFIIKEVFLIKRVLSNTTMTKSVIESFRSRHDARGLRIAEVEITNDGVKII